MATTLNLVLDTRRAKSGGTYPVKIRVIHDRISKDYPTKIDLTKTQFEDASSAKPSKAMKDVHISLSNQLAAARNAANSLKYFTFEALTKKLKNKVSTGVDVYSFYDRYISELRNDERIGTADSYRLSMESIKNFLRSKKLNKATLRFEEVTVNFLKEYERYMLSNDRTLTTIGIYLRSLRAIYNLAKEDEESLKDLYPFGKRKYQIPGKKKKKAALPKDSLKVLFEADVPIDSEQAKARALWFFSYTCNGINLKDVAELRWQDVEDSRILFVRAKTQNTTKGDQIELVAFRTEYVNQVLAKYSIPSTDDQDYVFGILNRNMTSEEKWRAVRNAVKFINQHMKRLAKSVGITEKLSYNWARHSFTTNAIRSGASMEMIQESLGHQNITTTQNYWAGFDDLAKRSITDKLMDFT